MVDRSTILSIRWRNVPPGSPAVNRAATLRILTGKG